MKKLLTVTLVMFFVLGLMSGVAVAASENAQEGFENSEAFESTDRGDDHFAHENLDDLRFRLGGATSVPGEAVNNANLDDSNLDESRTGSTLVEE